MNTKHETTVLNAALAGETNPEAAQRCSSANLAGRSVSAADMDASPAPRLVSTLPPPVLPHVTEQCAGWDIAVRNKLRSLTAPLALAADLHQAAANARRILAQTNPQLRVGGPMLDDQLHTLAQILAIGRVQTQFETNSSGGALAPAVRANLEAELFGYPFDLDPCQRPVYGYLTPLGYEPRAVEDYGSFALRLRPAILSRTTLSIADTLDRSVLPAAYTHLPITALIPNQSGYIRDSLNRLLTSRCMADLEDGYVEAQYHGGIKLADIEAILTWNLDAVPAALRAGFRGVGIEFREFEG